MASHIEVQDVLESAVAGIPEMADHIATLPDGQKAIALDALERHYAITAKNVGGADGPSRLWASAVVLRIREEMEQISEKAQISFVGVWSPEESSLAEKILTRDGVNPAVRRG